MPDITSNEVYAIDLNDPTGSWRRMADYPIAEGATHVPIATNGTKGYLIGGYLGRASPPPDMVECFEFDITGNGGTGSWRALPSLPMGRGGGGVFYVEELQTLVYSLGAWRRRGEGTNDQLTTWWLDLNNEAAGWIQKNDGPYLGRSPGLPEDSQKRISRIVHRNLTSVLSPIDPSRTRKSR